MQPMSRDAFKNGCHLGMWQKQRSRSPQKGQQVMQMTIGNALLRQKNVPKAQHLALSGGLRCLTLKNLVINLNHRKRNQIMDTGIGE